MIEMSKNTVTLTDREAAKFASQFLNDSVWKFIRKSKELAQELPEEVESGEVTSISELKFYETLDYIQMAMNDLRADVRNAYKALGEPRNTKKKFFDDEECHAS